MGQTRQPIEKRFLQHSKADSPLGQAMRDCGVENFTIEIIETCETYEQLNDREKFWIRVLKSQVSNGYNQSDGGETGERKLKDSSMEISKALKRFRNEFNLKQGDIAASIGIHQQAYQRYEAGKVLPIITALIKLADVYGVSIDYLVGRVERADEVVRRVRADKVSTEGGEGNGDDGAGKN